MQVTYIGLSDYFKRCIPKAKAKNFILIVSLIARYSDAPEIYEKLEVDWASLNDLTNNEILFVFSTQKIRRNASFFHLRGRKSYEGVMCPFVELLNGKGIEDNNGPFEFLYHDYRKINWKQRHSQTITQFAKDYNISEDQIPCLFLYDLVKDRYKVIPISPSTDVYELVKFIVKAIEEYGIRKANLDSELVKYKNIEAYYTLYEKLELEAKSDTSDRNVAIEKVLHEEITFKEAKEYILDAKLRKDLKRIGQWRRHYIIPFENNPLEVQCFNDLLDKKEANEKEIDLIWNDLTNIEFSNHTRDKDSIVEDVIKSCVKLQANSHYSTASEDQRNDYIRDMLKMARYEVHDQTRRGRSYAGKDAGEVDIFIEENGLPVTIVEALNLDSLNTSYLDKHIDKIYGYDTTGNAFNIVLSYVQVADFERFCKKYFEHVSKRTYKFPLISVEKDCLNEESKFSNICVMKTVHNRHGFNTSLYHVCVLIE